MPHSLGRHTQPEFACHHANPLRPPQRGHKYPRVLLFFPLSEDILINRWRCRIILFFKIFFHVSAPDFEENMFFRNDCPPAIRFYWSPQKSGYQPPNLYSFYQ